MTVDNASVPTFTCDLCGEIAQGEDPDFPPPGFATLKARPEGGLGVVVHLCLDTCLSIGAERIADGIAVDGHPQAEA